MKIYLASSWRNNHHPRILQLLRDAGHAIYDFRNPAPGNQGFAWDQIDPHWREWTPEQYRDALLHPIAAAGFRLDFQAMQWADACVLLLPAGASAAHEAGWCKGAGKTLIVHVCGLRDPELMYLTADAITLTDSQLLQALDVSSQSPRPSPERSGIERAIDYVDDLKTEDESFEARKLRKQAAATLHDLRRLMSVNPPSRSR